jgi:hypothetical protein
MKNSSFRVAALRERAGKLGLKRREIYAHDLDWPVIKALAIKLKNNRKYLNGANNDQSL